MTETTTSIKHNKSRQRILREWQRHITSVAEIWIWDYREKIHLAKRVGLEMSGAAPSSTLPARSRCLLKKGELNRWGKESEWNTLVSGKILIYCKNLRNSFFVIRGVDGSMIPLTVLESITRILSRYTSYILYNKLHDSFQKPWQTEKKEGGENVENAFPTSCDALVSSFM